MMWIQESSLTTLGIHCNVAKVAISFTKSTFEFKVKLVPCITTPLSIRKAALGSNLQIFLK